MVNTGTVKAYKAGYSVNDHTAVTTPTMDGKWTTNTEWVDSPVVSISANAIFRLKYVFAMVDTTFVIDQYYMIEFFNDNTNDTGDYWQICYARSTDFGATPPKGGNTPQTDCLRIDFVGHNKTGLTLYTGNGTGWNPITAYTWPTNIYIVDSISASPLSSTPHWIVEIKIDHIYFNISPEFWIRVAAYDASNPGAGVQSWPPGSVDVPNDWGLMSAIQTAFPETLGFGVMVLLSSVAVVVGSRYFRKRSRIESYGSGKP